MIVIVIMSEEFRIACRARRVWPDQRRVKADPVQLMGPRRKEKLLRRQAGGAKSSNGAAAAT